MLCNYKKTNKGNKIKEVIVAKKGGIFRYINKKIYGYTSEEFANYVKSNNKMCIVDTYHEGYEEQSKKWNKTSLCYIINWLELHLNNGIVVDMGAGNCQLAKLLTNNKVISVDIAFSMEKKDTININSTNNQLMKHGGYIESNMKNIPILKNCCADAVVYNLSLMTKDWPHGLKEGDRLLKQNGYLIIGELSSRIFNLKQLTEAIKINDYHIVNLHNIDKYFDVIICKKMKITTDYKLCDSKLLKGAS